MKCDRKKTCHATTDAVLPDRSRATSLICFEPLAAHPIRGDTGATIHVDRLVGVAFDV